MNERSFVYLCFIVLGAAGLLPWNIFITAHKYFFYKLRNVTDCNCNETSKPTELIEDIFNISLSQPADVVYHDPSVRRRLLSDDYVTSFDDDSRQLTHLQLTFEAWLTLTASLSGLLGSLVNAALATRIANVHRMVVGHVIVLLSLSAVAAMTVVNTDEYQQWFFVSNLVLANIANFCANGLICGASVGLACRFPVEIIQGSQFGQALVAVCIACTSIVTQASTPSPDINGLAYFAAGALFTLISMCAYLLLIRTEYAKTYMHDLLVRDDEDSLLGRVDSALLDDEDQMSDDSDADDLTVDAGHPSETPRSNEMRNSVRPRVVTVLKKLSYESANTVVILGVTLSVFPSVASLVVSNLHNKIWSEYFIPVLCFLLYNFGDACGRFATHWLRWPGVGSRWMCVLVMARVLFVPLLFLCNAQPRHHFSVLFPYDWEFAVIVFGLAVTNGYLLTLSNMHGAKRVEPREMELAGSLFWVFCVVGVAGGSGISFALVHLL